MSMSYNPKVHTAVTLDLLQSTDKPADSATHSHIPTKIMTKNMVQ